jgi:hypothetical protein
LQYIRRFGRADWNFVNEDKADAERPLDDVAERYGLATWKSFYGDECGDGEGGVDHKKVMKKINSTYGDELLKEKGGVPHDYRSSICYRYPWVPFSLTINRSDEEKADAKDTDKDKEVRYEIYDGERYTLVAEGKVADDKIEGLFPDIEDPVIFIDGVRIWLNPVVPEEPFEEEVVEDDGEKRIKDMYWSYGKDQIKLDDERSRHYVDLNLHVETENYKDGDIVKIVLKRNDKQPICEGVPEICLEGTVNNDNVIFENAFHGYKLNHYPQGESIWA